MNTHYHTLINGLAGTLAVAMIESLGGLETRVDLDPSAILDPSVEVEEEVVEAPNL